MNYKYNSGNIQRKDKIMTKRKNAFTLAEMLITLSVIGIVAALTIPGLVKNHNEKAWATAKDLIEKKLVETTRRMNIDGVMTGYSTTESFMNEFKKYMKVIKVCDNSKISKCYSSKVVSTGQNGDIEITTKDLKTTLQLGLKNWEKTNTISFVLADGTTIIMAYNTNCPEIDPYSSAGQSGQVDCMAMLIDVNGKKAPNKVGKDVKLTSGVSLVKCDQFIGDICTSLNVSGLNWQQAQDFCAAKGMKLPSTSDLRRLACNIYLKDGEPVTTISSNAGASGLTIKEEYLNAIAFNRSYWSSVVPSRSSTSAYYIAFGTTSVSGTDYYFGYKSKGTTDMETICIEK